jgi:hypothetical protein
MQAGRSHFLPADEATPLLPGRRARRPPHRGQTQTHSFRPRCRDQKYRRREATSAPNENHQTQPRRASVVA